MVDFRKALRDSKEGEEKMSEQKWSDPIEPGKPTAIDSEGVIVVGVYLGYTSFLQEKGEGAGRESRIHEVQIREGGTFTASVPGGAPRPGDSFRFWGSYDLDLKLRRVEEGDLVRIEYKGTERLPGPGDREMKKFDVRRSNTAKPAPAPVGQSTPF